MRVFGLICECTVHLSDSVARLDRHPVTVLSPIISLCVASSPLFVNVSLAIKLLTDYSLDRISSEC